MIKKFCSAEIRRSNMSQGPAEMAEKSLTIDNCDLNCAK